MPKYPCHKKLIGMLSLQEQQLNRMYGVYTQRWSDVLKGFGYGKSSSTNLWKGNKRIEAELDKIMLDFNAEVNNYIKGNIDLGWNASDDCNDDLVDKYTKGIDLNNKQVYYARNYEALAAFKTRKINGIDLSDRVWAMTYQTKDQIESILGSGIMEGRSAAKMARDLKGYLVEPDRRYRRIRNDQGKLIYSSPGKDYHPGQGVYRSSYKNALRLSRDQTNTAYRSADNERRKNLDFVTGIEVHLSDQHPKYDMCFTAWQTKITTSKGWKHIKDVEVGDLVLTHKGRFRKVTRLFKSTCNEVDKTELSYRVPYDNRSGLKKIAATSNHPFLVNGEWKPLSEAKEGDLIRLLATRCKKCDKKIPFHREYCSKSCASHNTATNQWKNEDHARSLSEKRRKVIEDNGGTIPYFDDWINSGENVKNLLDPKVRAKAKVTQKKVMAEMLKNGTHPFQDKEVRRKGAKALGNSKNKTFIEKKMQWLLDELKIEYKTGQIVFRKTAKKPNGSRRYYVPDFILPKYKIIIECDGDFWHSKTKEYDDKRQIELEALGYLVLRFKGSEIRNDLKMVSEEIQRVVYNHEGKYDFIEFPISEVKHYTQKQTTPITKYNFEVDEDHSYIANGVVVHNCDPLAGKYPKDFNFIGWHSQCICFSTSVLLPEKEFIEYVNGGTIRDQRYIRTIPKSAQNYLNDHSKQIKGWKNTPYFIQDNFKNTKDGFALKKSVITGKGNIPIKTPTVPAELPTSKLIKSTTDFTDNNVKKVIMSYANDRPENFIGGLRSVSIVKNLAGAMANERHYRNGKYLVEKGNKIKIRKVRWKMEDGNVFSPDQNLAGALKKISQGSDFSFQEEYALEALWHEMRHAGAKGWGNVRLRNERKVGSMEIINQFVARHTYDEFIKDLGGKSIHKASVISKGYGYSNAVDNFRNTLKKFKINEDSALRYFRDKIQTENYEDIDDILISYLRGNGVPRASVVVRDMFKTEVKTFSRLLDDL